MKLKMKYSFKRKNLSKMTKLKTILLFKKLKKAIKILQDQKHLTKIGKIKLANRSPNKNKIMRMSSLCMKNNISSSVRTTTLYIYSGPRMQ